MDTSAKIKFYDCILLHNEITLKYDISKDKLLFATMDCNNWIARTKHVALLYHFKCLNGSLLTQTKIEFTFTVQWNLFTGPVMSLKDLPMTRQPITYSIHIP